MGYSWIFCSNLILSSCFFLYTVAFDWEYGILYSLNQSTYAMKVFQNETSLSDLHVLAILVDEASGHGFEEAEEIAESWEDSGVPVGNGNKLTVYGNLLFGFQFEADGDVWIFNLDFAEPQNCVFFFEHDAEEFSFFLLDSSGILLEPLIEESGHEHTSSEETTIEDDDIEITSQTWGMSILASLLTSLISITGLGLFLTLKQDKSRKFVLDMSYAFGSGAVLAFAIVHLIPESYVFLEDYGTVEELGWKIGTVILAGLVFSFLVHISFSHQHENQPGITSSGQENRLISVENHNGTANAVPATEETKNIELPTSMVSPFSLGSTKNAVKEMKKIDAVCWNIFFGDLIHNFLDGALIAAAFAGCGQQTGWTITGALIAHEIPQEIADFFVLLKSGMSALQATFFNLLSGLFSVLGTIGLLAATSSSMTKEHLGYMLLWGAGIFVFIGATELLPEVLKEGKNWRMISMQMLAFILGAVVVSLPLLGHAHCEAGPLGHDHDHDHSETSSTTESTHDHDH